MRTYLLAFCPGQVDSRHAKKRILAQVQITLETYDLLTIDIRIIMRRQDLFRKNTKKLTNMRAIQKHLQCFAVKLKCLENYFLVFLQILDKKSEKLFHFLFDICGTLLYSFTFQFCFGIMYRRENQRQVMKDP